MKRVVAIAPARASSAVPCGRATPTARAVPALPRPRKRLTREELTPLARDALFRAAGKVVGESGYKDASVARITEAAGATAAVTTTAAASAATKAAATATRCPWLHRAAK